MNQTSQPIQTAASQTAATQGFRDAAAELVQIGLRVARLVGQVADAETALAEAASQARVAEGVPAVASSLAEAIAADHAAAAAAEARQTVVARAETVAAAFARVSRAIRLTILLAERLDRGWARGAPDHRRAEALQHIARGVEDAIARESDGERAADLTAALRERLESLDTETGLGDRTAEQIIAIICRDLGLDPVRMTLRSPLPARFGACYADEDAVPFSGGARSWRAHPKQRRPDG